MGKGRRPTPTAIKIANGNPGKRPLPVAEPRPDVSTASVPKSLLDLADVIAIEKWNEIAPQLTRVRALTKTDESVLEAFCVTYSTWLKNERICQTSEIYETEGKHGKMMRKHPARDIADKAAARLKALGVELGLTPAGRTRIKAVEDGQLQLPLDNDYDDEFFGSSNSGTQPERAN